MEQTAVVLILLCKPQTVPYLLVFFLIVTMILLSVFLQPEEQMEASLKLVSSSSHNHLLISLLPVSKVFWWLQSHHSREYGGWHRTCSYGVTAKTFLGIFKPEWKCGGWTQSSLLLRGHEWVKGEYHLFWEVVIGAVINTRTLPEASRSLGEGGNFT